MGGLNVSKMWAPLLPHSSLTDSSPPPVLQGPRWALSTPWLQGLCLRAFPTTLSLPHSPVLPVLSPRSHNSHPLFGVEKVRNAWVPVALLASGPWLKHAFLGFLFQQQGRREKRKGREAMLYLMSIIKPVS